MEINDGIDIFENQTKKNERKSRNNCKKHLCSNRKMLQQDTNRKTFWKVVALPSILMGNQVANFNLNKVNELQTIENGVYRKILGAA